MLEPELKPAAPASPAGPRGPTVPAARTPGLRAEAAATAPAQEREAALADAQLLGHLALINPQIGGFIGPPSLSRRNARPLLVGGSTGQICPMVFALPISRYTTQCASSGPRLNMPVRAPQQLAEAPQFHRHNHLAYQPLVDPEGKLCLSIAVP